MALSNCTRGVCPTAEEEAGGEGTGTCKYVAGQGKASQPSGLTWLLPWLCLLLPVSALPPCVVPAGKAKRISVGATCSSPWGRGGQAQAAGAVPRTSHTYDLVHCFRCPPVPSCLPPFSPTPPPSSASPAYVPLPLPPTPSVLTEMRSVAPSAADSRDAPQGSAMWARIPLELGLLIRSAHPRERAWRGGTLRSRAARGCRRSRGPRSR